MNKITVKEFLSTFSLLPYSVEFYECGMLLNGDSSEVSDWNVNYVRGIYYKVYEPSIGDNDFAYVKPRKFEILIELEVIRDEQSAFLDPTLRDQRLRYEGHDAAHTLRKLADKIEVCGGDLRKLADELDTYVLDAMDHDEYMKATKVLEKTIEMARNTVEAMPSIETYYKEWSNKL